MPKQWTTVTLDERVIRAVGLDLLERIWERGNLDEDEALGLAVEEQHRACRG
jgi:hypothetical protein